MAEFKLALPTLFLHEGRYVHLASDPGGATNYGISLRFLMQTGDLNLDGWRDGDINHDGKINVEDIKALDQDKAAELYRLYFWEKNGYAKIDSQIVATKMLSLSANMGSYPANLICQRAIRAASGKKVSQDGMLGAQSFIGINLSKPELLHTALKSEAAGYYRSIRYDGSKNFLEGWLNRAYSDSV